MYIYMLNSRMNLEVILVGFCICLLSNAYEKQEWFHAKHGAPLQKMNRCFLKKNLKQEMRHNK